MFSCDCLLNFLFANGSVWRIESNALHVLQMLKFHCIWLDIADLLLLIKEYVLGMLLETEGNDCLMRFETFNGDHFKSL